jgi:hypothetical protein
MSRYDAILATDQAGPEPEPQPTPPEHVPPPITVDPRPDLADDSELWTRLLELAEAEDRMFAGTLHGFRCLGTRIKRGRNGYVLRPDIDPTGDTAWTSQREEMKEEWLRPHISKIANLLRCL